LPSGSIMAVKVTAATTKGHQLAEQEWNVVKAACEIFGAKSVIRDSTYSKICIGEFA
jgi:hypothetical protein